MYSAVYLLVDRRYIIRSNMYTVYIAPFYRLLPFISTIYSTLYQIFIELYSLFNIIFIRMILVFAANQFKWSPGIISWTWIKAYKRSIFRLDQFFSSFYIWWGILSAGIDNKSFLMSREIVSNKAEQCFMEFSVEDTWSIATKQQEQTTINK